MRKTYASPIRDAAARRTRESVLAAAHDAFARAGFGATVAGIAASAGVSRATVELAFGTKAALLDAVVDVALAGDDEPVAVLDRPWVVGLTARPAPGFLDGAAAAFAAGAGRVAPLLRALDEGATRGDPTLAALAARLQRQRQVMAAWLVDRLVEKHALAADLSVPDAVETTLVLLDPLLHRRLLVERGWPTERLGAWLARSFRRLLLAGPPPEHPGDGGQSGRGA